MVQKSSRPRGRPRSYDPDAALDQARDAFWRAGYSATSLDDLARATGLNRPSLYGAFGDKRELYLKALRRSREEMVAAMTAVLSADGPLETSLARLYDGAAAIYTRGEEAQRGCFLIGTGVTESVEDAAVREEMAGALADIDAAFEVRLDRAIAESELPKDADAKVLARIAAGCMHSLAVRARTGAPIAELSELGRAAAALIASAGAVRPA